MRLLFRKAVLAKVALFGTPTILLYASKMKQIQPDFEVSLMGGWLGSALK